EAARLVLRVGEAVCRARGELARAAGERLGVESGPGKLGWEPRGPCVIPASGRAVVDLDFHQLGTLPSRCENASARVRRSVSFVVNERASRRSPSVLSRRYATRPSADERSRSISPFSSARRTSSVTVLWAICS